MQPGSNYPYPNSRSHPVFSSGKKIEFQKQISSYQTVYYRDLDQARFVVDCKSHGSPGDRTHYINGTFFDLGDEQGFRINSKWAEKIYSFCNGLDWELWNRNKANFKRMVLANLNPNLFKKLTRGN